MDETTQDNSQVYVITHAKDGWTFQQHDVIPEEFAVVLKCGGCGQLIKVQQVTFEDPVEESKETLQQDTEPQQQKEEQQATTPEIPQETRPKKNRKSKRESVENDVRTE